MSADLVLDEVGLDSYAPGPIATAMGDSHGIASLMTFALVFSGTSRPYV